MNEHTKAPDQRLVTDDADPDGLLQGRVVDPTTLAGEWKHVPEEAPTGLGKVWGRAGEGPSGRQEWVEISGATGLGVVEIVPALATVATPDVPARIFGYGFTAATTVDCGGTNLPKVLVSPNEMTVTIPVQSVLTPGVVAVTVADGSGPGKGAAGFHYLAAYATAGLQITGLIPDKVIIPSTTQVLVNVYGLEFDASTEILMDTTVLAKTLVSASHMTCMVDPSPETVYRAAIFTVREGATVGAGAEAFEFIQQATTVLSIEFVNQNTVPIGGPDIVVSAHGSKFTPTTEVLLDGTPVTPAATVISPTEMEFTIKPATETVRRALITVRDGATAGVGDAPFYFTEAAAAPYHFGKGLSIDDTTRVVDLQPAGPTANLLGGTWAEARSATQGLELDVSATIADHGKISVPLATDLLAGSIVEPPPDDKSYLRKRDAAGVSAWVEEAAPPLAIEFIIPNTVEVGSAPLTIEVHGTKFSAATTVNFGTATPAVTYVSPTELTFQIDPLNETVRTLSVTINDSGLPGQGDAPFYFRASDKLYQGTWEPTTNTPDILTPPKGDKWMWLVNTTDPRKDELVPTTIPGIGGQTTREGDQVVWDATAATFSLVGTRALAVTDMVPNQGLTTAPAFDAHVYGTGFTATTVVLFEGVPIPTNFRDSTKLRINIDPATMIPPARGFVVVGVRDTVGPVEGRGAAGFQWLEKVVVQPAGETLAKAGIVYVPPDRGLQINPLDGMLTAKIASDKLHGVILDAPVSTPPVTPEKVYVRKFGQWAEGQAKTDFGLGLKLDDGADPGDPQIVHLTPAGHDPDRLGGVYGTGPRSATEGLDIDPAAGRITVPLATLELAGAHTEPPRDGLDYSRKWDAATSLWVWDPALTPGLHVTEIMPDKAVINTTPAPAPVTVHVFGGNFTATTRVLLDGTPTATTLVSQNEVTYQALPAAETVARTVVVTVDDTAPVAPDTGVGAGGDAFDFFVSSTSVDYGIGLSLDPGAPGDPPIVNLTPLGPAANLLGGAWVAPRTDLQGLTISLGAAANGELRLDPATDLLLGGIVEPLPDGKNYARVRSTAGVSTWVEVIGSLVHTDDAPPANPADGMLWWNSSTGALYVYYVDINSGQWVECGSSGGGTKEIFSGDTPPATPTDNTLWFDSTNGNLFFRYNDGSSAQWIMTDLGEAPLTGEMFARQNAQWVVTTTVARSELDAANTRISVLEERLARLEARAH
jgi:IPT/TIG domain